MRNAKKCDFVRISDEDSDIMGRYLCGKRKSLEHTHGRRKEVALCL